MTAQQQALYAELQKPQTVADVVAKIKKTDFNDPASRASLVEYLGRSTIPTIPFGVQSTSQLFIAACPSTHMNSTNSWTNDQYDGQKPGDASDTLSKLEITGTTQPQLKVFQSVGNLYRKRKDDRTPVHENYIVAINPFDGSYWLIRNFRPVDGMSGEEIVVPDYQGVYTLARVLNADAVLGNTTAETKLDPNMIYTILGKDMKVGGFVSNADYESAKQAAKASATAHAAP
ncbi:hypothetical protein B7494_g5592 [Chlorociboria aeruginascens]|nr:hypothetical protein B7494_g5592 [Chlorociboria aeruginascens]